MKNYLKNNNLFSLALKKYVLNMLYVWYWRAEHWRSSLEDIALTLPIKVMVEGQRLMSSNTYNLLIGGGIGLDAASL